jgi:hypothetical protein
LGFDYAVGEEGGPISGGELDERFRIGFTGSDAEVQAGLERDSFAPVKGLSEVPHKPAA